MVQRLWLLRQILYSDVVKADCKYCVQENDVIL